jgi:hypothetical protein
MWDEKVKCDGCDDWFNLSNLTPIEGYWFCDVCLIHMPFDVEDYLEEEKDG